MKKQNVLALTLVAGLSAGCSEAVQGQSAPETLVPPTDATPPSVAMPSTGGHIPPPHTPNMVYFQPRLQDMHNLKSMEIPSGLIKMVAEPGADNSWTADNCRSDNATRFLKENPHVSQVLTFSLGRLGLDYTLQRMTPAQEKQLDYALVIAPGNKQDFTDSCDKPEASFRIYEWLSDNPDAHLTFIADARTAQDNHRGLRELYLNHPAAKSIFGQVTLCTSSLGHEDTWNRFKGLAVFDPIDQPGECPQDTKWVDWTTG
ncbi:MAG TPA: hypothetical protein VF733_06520 [Candidatus Saccharimonadales bacterium]